MSDFYISDSREKLNIPWVCHQLRSSYWGEWLDDARIQRALLRSLVFGVYHDDVMDAGEIAVCGEQVGFGRVVTDGATFSSVMDIIIDEPYRNRGLGTRLMEAMLAHPDVCETVCIISTRDASLWYDKFGFEPCPIVMKRDPDAR